MTAPEDGIQRQPNEPLPASEDGIRPLPNWRTDPDLFPEDADPENPSDEELEAFVGSNAGYYVPRWRAMLDGESSHSGFNWAGFLISPIWLPYRKMYVTTGLFYAAVILVSLGAAVFYRARLQVEVPFGLQLFFNLAFSLVVAAYGNSWYLARARRVIKEVRELGFYRQEHMETLAERGGTNLPIALGLFGALMLASLVLDRGLELLLPLGP